MTVEAFLQSIQRFHRDFGTVKAREDKMLTALGQFETDLTGLVRGDLRTRAEFANLTKKLRSEIISSMKNWTNSRQHISPVRKLSERYQDRPIIFVFGKVNSGKSSLMNFLVEELERVGAKTQGFVVEDGGLKRTPARFETGVTETTSRIQGVEIERSLTLIDSPGLYSVTPKNEKLTKRYTDSADAILWLSSSDSPGQVQELKDLKAELEREKPLQPVITKSDRIVESWCDDKQEPRRERRNKPANDRKGQEADVRKRAQQLGLAKEIRPVVSISTMAYQESNRSAADWEEAGLGTLFERFIEIVDNAKRYKIEEKASQVVRNYIEDKVLGELEDSVGPKIKELADLSERSMARLNRSKERLAAEVKSSAMAALERIVDEHRHDQNTRAISRKFNTAIDEQLTGVLRRELTGYVSDIASRLMSVEGLVSVSPDELGTFDDVTVEVAQVKGQEWQSISASGGGIIGGVAAGAAGGSIFPGVGTIIGAVLGGILGSLGGNAVGKELFVETEMVSKRVGTSTVSLIEKAERKADAAIMRKVDEVVKSVVEIYQSTKRFADAVSSEIERFKGKIG